MSDETATQALTARISDAMVGVVAEYTGRGPTKAKTIMNRDLVVVLLQDGLTKGERTLVANGKAEEVLHIRHTFQETFRHDAVKAVERITGRSVIAFMSDNHIDPDMAIEAFVLEPEPA